MALGNIRYQNGFSLIALAVIMMLLGGALIVAIAPRGNTQFDMVNATQKKLDKIKIAIGTYYGNNGIYPCPARFDRVVAYSGAAPVFGIEVNACAASTACSAISGAVFCPCSAKTWVGAVPVRTLSLPDDYAFDAWGNRFTYAVNNSTTFNITNSNGTVIASVNFHALSHGADGIGAYTKAGILGVACNLTNMPGGASTSTTTSEYQNCDFANNDTFIFRTRDTSSGSLTYYDDVSFKY